MRKLGGVLLSSVMVAAMAFATAVPAMAAGGQTVPLKGTGTDFSGTWQNTFTLGAPVGTNPSSWHLVYTGNNVSDITYMQITFTNGYVFVWNPSMGFSTNSGGNNPGFVIIAPYDWKINLAGSYLVTNDTKNVNFNISGFHQGSSDTKGAIEPALEAYQQYNLTTIQPVWQQTIQPVWQKTYQPMWQKTIQPIWQKTTEPIWQKTIQPVWQKTIQPVYQKTIQPVWQKTTQPVRQKTVQPVWQQTIQPVWQKTYQPYQVPTFTRPTAQVSDTLVTRLTYSNNTASAVPVNGGVFKNGHTYVAVNVAAASAPGGVWLPIADSSYNSNGKKTPDQYNKPIGVMYNVQISGGKITISFGPEVISASVGAYAVGALNGNADKAFPGNAPKHSSMSYTLDMPATTTGGMIYLYVHLEGIKWYTSMTYQFAGWQADPTRTQLVSDLWVRDVVTKDAWVRNDTTDAWVRDDVTDAWVRDDTTEQWIRDEVTDAWVRDDVTKDELVRTDLAKDEWVRDVVTKDAWLRDDKTTVAMTELYTPVVTMVVKDAANTVVYSGPMQPVTDLAAGTYTVTISSADFADRTVTVTVTNGATAAADFGTVYVTVPDKTETLDKIYDPAIVLAKIYDTDIVLPKSYLADIVLPKTYLADITLPKTYLADIVLPKTYLADVTLPKSYLADIVLAKTYLPDVTLAPTYLTDIVLAKTYDPDIVLAPTYTTDAYLPVIQLGDPTDPYGPYAIRLN